MDICKMNEIMYIQYKEWRKGILERQLNLEPCTHDCLCHSARKDFSTFAELSGVIDFDTMLGMEIKYDFYEDSEKDEIERFLRWLSL